MNAISVITRSTLRERTILFTIVLTLCAVGVVLFGGISAQAQSGCNGNPSYIQGGDGSCTDISGSQTDPAQVVLTANASSIQTGSNSLLSWGSDNSTTNYPYDYCTLDNGIGNVPVTGSLSVSPTTTTTYGIFCRHTVQYSTPCGNTNCFTYSYVDTQSSATVTVTPNPTLVASCSVNPTSIPTGGSATWSATASGGNGSYTYSWSGTDGLSGSTAAVSKPYSTAGTKSGSVTVTSGAQSVTQACGNGLNVITPSSPDVTPISLTPSTVVAQQATTFTATMHNGGTAVTPSFYSTAYVCQTGDTACQNSIIALRTKPSFLAEVFSLFPQIAHAAASVNLTFSRLTLAAGATGAQTSSNTFPSPGSYQVRLCGDLPANEVPESNEQNNCGNWQVLTVCPSDNTVDGSGNCVAPAPPAAPAPTCGLSASPTNSVPSTLTWSSTNATTCTPGGFSTGGALNGSVSVGTAGPYNFSCTGTGGSCSASTLITSGGSTCSGSPVMTITASPARVTSGQTSTIAWTATNVPGASPSCSISGPGLSRNAGAGAAPTCSITNDSAAPTINAQSTYTITCAGVSKSVTVNVVPKFINF